MEYKKIEGDGKMKLKHLPNELEIFKTTGRMSKNVELMFNSLKTIPLTFISKHDSVIAVLIIFVA